MELPSEAVDKYGIYHEFTPEPRDVIITNPLTVTDHASRFLLLCEALESTRGRTRHSA